MVPRSPSQSVAPVPCRRGVLSDDGVSFQMTVSTVVDTRLDCTVLNDNTSLESFLLLRVAGPWLLLNESPDSRIRYHDSVYPAHLAY